jgi:hypothetical protein
MFNPSRDEVRRFFSQAWSRHASKEILSPQEDIACQIISWHPEYQVLIKEYDETKVDAYADASNPFLHLSLHLALWEQLSIDQPKGIVSIYQEALQKSRKSEHDIMHVFMDALLEVLSISQKQGVMPNGDLYLSQIQMRLKNKVDFDPKSG